MYTSSIYVLICIFSVEVCLVGVFPHSVSTRRDRCVRVYAPLTLASPLTRKQNSNRADVYWVSCGGVVNMLLVLPITSFFITIYGVVCVQLVHFSIGDWNDLYTAHVIIIIKSEVSTFSHCYHIFPWLCVWDVCYIIFCYLLHIHSGKTANLFKLLLCSLWWLQIIGYILSWRSYSFVCTLHHLIIIIVQTYLKTLNLYNACQIYFVECVIKIMHILSVIHYTIRGVVCFQFTHFLVMIERIYILCVIIIIKSEVWNITHCLGLGHETMVCAVCLFVFLHTYMVIIAKCCFTPNISWFLILAMD